MLVDYDNEEDDPSPTRAFVDVRCDKELFERTVAEFPGPKN
jgi:hypothetical protein